MHTQMMMVSIIMIIIAMMTILMNELGYAL